MLPVTLSCSYAFMLPVASGTNAIIFEAGKMKNKDMVVPGFFLKIICLSITLFMINTWGSVVLDLNGFRFNTTLIEAHKMTTLTS